MEKGSEVSKKFLKNWQEKVEEELEEEENEDHEDVAE